MASAPAPAGPAEAWPLLLKTETRTLLNAGGSLQPSASTEPSNPDGPDADADGWEDLPGLSDALGTLTDNGGQPSFTIDLSQGAFFPSTLPRKRVDARTRAEQLEAQERAWDKAMPDLVDAYLAWKHRAALARDTSASAAASAAAQPTSATGDWFTVAAICDTSFERHLRVEQANNETASISLMRTGMMACTPIMPVVAISVGLLELYYRVRRRAPRLGIQPFVRALCDIHMCPYRPFLREQFSSAFDRYLAVLREVQRRVDGALGRDTPHWRALNACPPCSYKLEGEVELAIPGFIAMDGGQSMKRSATAGLADARVYHSDYRIPPEEVDLCADEVRRRVVPKKKKQDTEPDAPAFVTLNESGEPGDDAPTPSLCAHRWKNAKAEHHKIAPGMYTQTGGFVSMCRHGVVLWFAEMIRSGELAKYPLAIISRMLRVGMCGTRCGYDIGCAFQGTLDRSSLGLRAREAKITSGLNSFHGYGHNRLCQLAHHPLYQTGFGLEDLEICERFFSWLNGIGGVVRHASHYHWLQAFDLGILQWDEDKYHEISKFLLNNVRQAVRLKEEYEPLLSEFKRRTSLTDTDIEGWLEEERAYLEGLRAEPEEVGLKMDYIAMLNELEEAETALASKQSDYQDGLRAPSEEEIARKRLSPAAVTKLYKARVDAHNKYMKILEAVLALEGVLGIDLRWTTSSREYQDGLVEMAERDWRRALDRLELLMVQRMFELAKSHVFGYKLREAIGKGLKSRSQAIRTAVTRYNELAAALNPPAAPVNFATLMEWTEVQEFELLRRSRAGDVREKAWAQPANRLMAAKYYKVLRANEELIRCRIEARRLMTAMHDEERQLETTLGRLTASNPALGYELRELIARRMAVNDQHRFFLAKLAAIPGFEDILTPGVRLGTQDTEPAPVRAAGTQVIEPAPAHAAGRPPAADEHGDVWNVEAVENDGHEVEEEELHALHDYIATVDD
ncbi:hypothetical protein AURDEDRAFT_177197 [Auricularia subglabra TFB-10046 SS5]|uniref:CxC1-like cysteine cluster associated with KDZ transposases domain-containing protein n=1 Tax=Auricularia subglabra (strain TFB-10046 / SS5) TaxID=717982 RepID=J0WPC7_AURST|nr:hypothetical protein AURDEDRAFT_177197 [Auricularia subglabra TFB-10046 SS5]